MLARLANPLKLLTGLWLGVVIAAMFVWVPAHEGLGNVGRIVIVHVPTGWLASVAFLLSAIYSGLYLRRGRLADDAKALAAAELGLLFSALATLTGAIFAKVVWGTYWNWDPRETAIAVLMLIYAAYFALRSSLEDAQRRRRLGAIYALLAFVTVPFLIFIIPRITDSTLHPNCAILNTPGCEGVSLAQGGKVIGQVDDFRLELLGVETAGDLTTAVVEVRSPDGALATLRPSFDRAAGRAVAILKVPDTLRELQIKRIAPGGAGETIELALANVGNVGLLTERRTLVTFYAALIGFTALFVWLWRLRAALLHLGDHLLSQGYAA